MAVQTTSMSQIRWSTVSKFWGSFWNLPSPRTSSVTWECGYTNSQTSPIWCLFWWEYCSSVTSCFLLENMKPLFTFTAFMCHIWHWVFWILFSSGPSCTIMCTTTVGSSFSTGTSAHQSSLINDMLVFFYVFITGLDKIFLLFSWQIGDDHSACFSHPVERYCWSDRRCWWPTVGTTERCAGSHLGTS